MVFRIIHQVAAAYELAIAVEINKPNGFFVEHPQETRRTATVLDVGLAIGIGGRQKDADLRLDKQLKVFTDFGFPAAIVLHAGIGTPRTLSALNGFNRIGERYITGVEKW